MQQDPTEVTSEEQVGTQAENPAEAKNALELEATSQESSAPVVGELPDAGSRALEGAARRSDVASGRGRRVGAKLVGHEGETRSPLTSAQRLLILDTWQRSGLTAEGFAGMVGLSKHTLYLWKKRFEQLGPAGLTDQPRGAPKGSKLSEATRRAILMLKRVHAEWGCERIAAVLWRSEGYEASSGAVARVLKEEGYESEERPSTSHEPVQRRFERARPNQLWQTDLFTFLLKRENRRVYLVVFLDDHSRFVVGFGVHATPSGGLVREVLEAGVANFGPPEEVLTDNGPQYQTWRGKSAFSRLLEKRGIRHLVARPRHPQTLGKVERFWGTLWRECLEAAVFQDLSDARTRVGLFIDYYNFLRPHQGLEGLVPADRFFEAAEEVRRTLQARVAENALDLARHGVPRKSFYLTGKVGEQAIALHAEGERVILTTGDGRREEVDLKAPGRRVEPGEEPVLPEPVTPQGGKELETSGGES